MKSYHVAWGLVALLLVLAADRLRIMRGDGAPGLREAAAIAEVEQAVGPKFGGAGRWWRQYTFVDQPVPGTPYRDAKVGDARGVFAQWQAHDALLDRSTYANPNVALLRDRQDVADVGESVVNIEYDLRTHRIVFARYGGT